MMLKKRCFITVASLLFIAACNDGTTKFPGGGYAENEEFYPNQADPNNIHLNVEVLQRQLAQGKNGVSVKLPLPEGGFTEFQVFDSGTMPLELAQRYPRIHSLKGRDVQGRRLRLDIYEDSLQAMVFDTQGNWTVQPMDGADKNRYQSLPYMGPRNLSTAIQPLSDSIASLPALTVNPVTDNVRRDYRIAIAATSDYTAKFGGTVAGGLAAVIYMLNRINEVFETDVGVHLTLVADNDKIIYTDRATDPYQNLTGDLLNTANVENLNKVLGESSFDVGHVVTMANDPRGYVEGNVCTNRKAAGQTIMGYRSGVPFFESVLAHELGHAFGARHTFSSCKGVPSISESSAVEPGSGSTIMAYPTSCLPSENLQARHDFYFHAKSIDEINALISGPTASCGTKHLNASKAPSINPRSMPGDGTILTIPAKTPFFLSAEAMSDAKAMLTYSWEQMDPRQTKSFEEIAIEKFLSERGLTEDDLNNNFDEIMAEFLKNPPPPPADVVLTDNGTDPIFRSYPPSTNPVRTFPRMAAVLGDEPLGKGEVYPETNRALNFRLTVRDNRDMQASTASADTRINVVNTGSPFAVTRPNNILATSGSVQTIAWNVANTDRAPISCRKVRIDLSTDGGYHYLTKPLAAGVPNTGSAQITLPILDKNTTKARVKVSCVDNVFFAVSPTNFVIQ